MKGGARVWDACVCPPSRYTVSPVEKLTNRTTGTLPVRSRYGRGTVEVRSWCGRGVRSRYGHGMVEVRSGFSRRTVEVRHTV